MYNKLLKNGTAIAMIVGTIMIALFGIGIMTGETTVNDAGVEVVEVGLGLDNNNSYCSCIYSHVVEHSQGHIYFR
ncbi:MAG: hypothetical protein IPG79_00375 [Saprospiraceae bacterium]|nr:hypothetical protein [Saprospiraceae bacterium]